jgi:hypothetical protein
MAADVIAHYSARASVETPKCIVFVLCGAPVPVKPRKNSTGEPRTVDIESSQRCDIVPLEARISQQRS